jgi:hypothetical protein
MHNFDAHLRNLSKLSKYAREKPFSFPEPNWHMLTLVLLERF